MNVLLLVPHAVEGTAFFSDRNTGVRIKGGQPDEIVVSNFGEVIVRRGLGLYLTQERNRMCQNMPERDGLTPE